MKISVWKQRGGDLISQSQPEWGWQVGAAGTTLACSVEAGMCAKDTCSIKTAYNETPVTLSLSQTRTP